MSTAIDDLEVSVRTMQRLLALGVDTVDELLALPSIEAPTRVRDELVEVLADLGHAYAGAWITPPPVELIPIAGTVADRWRTIAGWLATASPGTLATFRPPASEADIAAAEAELGCRLPDDYRAFLQLHDGQEDLGPMVKFCTLVPVGDLAERRDETAAILAEGSFDDGAVAPGIAPVAWHPDWVLIGEFQRDFLVLDLAPADGGTRGQIFVGYVDDDARTMVASSFAEFLAVYFRELQDGTIDLSDYADADSADSDLDAD